MYPRVFVTRSFRPNPNMSEELEDGTESKLDQALLDFMRRSDAGQIEDRDVFLNEYPEIATQLRTLLDAADWIENMAGPTLSELADSTAKAKIDNLQTTVPTDEARRDLNAFTMPVVPSTYVT